MGKEKFGGEAVSLLQNTLINKGDKDGIEDIEDIEGIADIEKQEASFVYSHIHIKTFNSIISTILLKIPCADKDFANCNYLFAAKVMKKYKLGKFFFLWQKPLTNSP